MLKLHLLLLRHKIWQQRGIALIAVLWLLGLMMVMTAILLAAVKGRGMVAQQLSQQMQAKVTLDSALRVALIEMALPSQQSAGSYWTPGMKRLVSVGLRSVSVEISLESGRIDLNAANADLLLAYFAANGFSEGKAGTIANRILDWRDSDSERSHDGAELNDYRAAGNTFGPRNASFRSVAELKQVLGLVEMPDTLFDGLTIYSGEAEVLEIAATPAVRNALSWADNKHLGNRRWLNERGPLIRQPLIGQVVRARACSDVGTYCREVIARITGNSRVPLHFFGWQGGPQ